jgi:hypothetical protein
MYFKDFPRFVYDFKYADKDIRTEIVTDITRNVRFRKELMKNVTQFDEYDVQDGETPEIIAEKLYGNSQYHWILMLLNERYDYISDFPLDETALVKHIESSYPDVVFNTNDKTSTLSNVVLKMGVRYPDASYSEEELALKNFMANGTDTTTYYGGSYADIDSSGRVNSSDARSWLLVSRAQEGDVRLTTAIGGIDITPQEIIDQIVAIQNATPGTFPSAMFLPSAYYAVHHYVDHEGFIVDKSNPEATAVYNDQYERALNEEKRRIKVLAPNMIATILKNYKDLL